MIKIFLTNPESLIPFDPFIGILVVTVIFIFIVIVCEIFRTK